MRASSTASFAEPLRSDVQPSSAWPSATPMLRSTVESVRSRCQRETGSFSVMCRSSAFASPRLPSEFSKSIGLTLCGIVDEPTSPSVELLPEVAERDVAPDVAIEIDQHRVRRARRRRRARPCVVRLDLRRVRIELEAERRHDARGELLPVDVGIRGDVRVVVADGAVHLALERHALDRRDLRARAARTTFAISLPSVVGVAGWPCVRASIGTVGVRVRERLQRRRDRRAARAAAPRAAPARASRRARGC